MPYKDREKQLEAQREHYRNNKQKYLENHRKTRDKRRKFVNDYKAEKKCKYCPEDDYCCLEFHHTDPSIKDDNISHLLRNRSLIMVKNEIEKCIVICANCHRKLHAGRYMGN